MNKQEFLSQLREGLSGLPQNDIDERLIFYSEMIDDSIEEGLSEEEAVLAVGSVNEIVSHIVTEIPITKVVKDRINENRKLRVWEIVFLVLGSPIWFSLLIALVAVVFSLYVVLWSVIISLWAVLISLVACCVSFIVAGIGYAFTVYYLSGIALIGASAVCAGASIFMFYGCKFATKFIFVLTKKPMFWIKNCIIKRRGV